MKKQGFLNIFCIVFFGLTMFFSSCDTIEKDKIGFVSFGANYHIINCPSTLTIYVDNHKIGTLLSPTDSIRDCGEDTNITKELLIGEHTYKVEIRPESGTACSKDIHGIFTITENTCEKIFIDYLQVFGNVSDCDQDVLISEFEYQKAPNDPFSIISLNIVGDCLLVKFSASACDGNTWIVKLIDSGMIAESYPCQRTLRLSLDNKEECTAVPSKKISFNIKDLQIEGNDKVILHVSGQQLLYEY